MKLEVPSIGRREFLVGAAAATLLAACGGGDSAKTAAASDQKKKWSGLRSSSDLYRSETPQRFAFALTDGRRVAGGQSAQVGFAAPGDKRTGTITPARYRAEGIGGGRGVYVVEATLPTTGIWKAGVLLENGEQFTLPFEVAEAAHAPVIGAPAPRAASPLGGRTLGVDPICTQDPACPLHNQSIETITGTGTPTAIMFATPARCQTTYCGPVLELLNELVPDYRGRVGFGHVEIYRGPTGTGLSPTVAAWGLQSEPWLFTVDGAGRIVRRLDGAFDRSEMRDALDELVA